MVKLVVKCTVSDDVCQAKGPTKLGLMAAGLHFGHSCYRQTIEIRIMQFNSFWSTDFP